MSEAQEMLDRLKRLPNFKAVLYHDDDWQFDFDAVKVTADGLNVSDLDNNVFYKVVFRRGYNCYGCTTEKPFADYAMAHFEDTALDAKMSQVSILKNILRCYVARQGKVRYRVVGLRYLDDDTLLRAFQLIDPRNVVPTRVSDNTAVRLHLR